MSRHASRTAAVCILAAVVLNGCRSDPQPEVLVFAAASLSDSLLPIAELHVTRTGRDVSFNFAASNLLARQIAAGAPACVFISANRAEVRWLTERGLVDEPRSVELLGNALVVVAPRNRPLTMNEASDLLALERIALADPAGVPAGVHARDWLERLGLWADIAGHVVPTLDVRAALAAVASGDVDAGVVYATDALTSDAVVVAWRVPAELTRITYIAAPILGCDDDRAASFLATLQGEEAGAVFERQGFVALHAGAKR